MKKISVLLIVVATAVASSCGGGNKPEQTKSEVKEAPAAISGAEVYNRTCNACHQQNGEGMEGTFPPLAQSDFLSDRESVIRQVTKGSSGEIKVNGKTYNNAMPPQQLSDEECAAVLTYVYSNFGNSGAAFTADEVKAVRAKL